MRKPEHHFFTCASFRVGCEAKGVCTNKNAPDLLGYLENEIIDRGLDAMVTSCGCMKRCKVGPVMVDYPSGKWYGELDEEKLDAILDAIEDGADTAELELA